MLFILTNAPASFQEMMDTICKDMQGCVSVINNIFTCGGNIEAEYKARMKKVLQQCVKHRLPVHVYKRMFHVYKTISLVHVINRQEVK